MNTLNTLPAFTAAKLPARLRYTVRAETPNGFVLRATRDMLQDAEFLAADWRDMGYHQVGIQIHQ